MRPVSFFLGIVFAGSCTSPHVAPRTKAQLETEIVEAKNPVLRGALMQLTDPASYDASYRSISYPSGDVPKNRGACADVVVRALRTAGIDLQKAIHEDIASGAYTRITQPDRNIDHRRVVNQEVWFKRHAMSLEFEDRTWIAGDIVSWRLNDGRAHIGIVSDKVGVSGNPLVVHNIGLVAEQDVLKAWKIVGHFRLKN